MVIINYSQIRNNLLEYTKTNQIGLTLKNNSYGFNIEKIIKYCDDLVSFYAVINLAEAIEIRKLTSKRILLLEFSNQIDLIKRYDLTPTAKNYNEIALYDKNDIVYEIIVDVGMNRFGFKTINNSILNEKNAVGYYIHMPYYSLNLSKKLNDTISILKENNKKFHVGGSVMLNRCSYMLRIGFALYNNSISLYARVVDVRLVNKGERIGYDGKYLANRTHLFAILDVGYYDGISSSYNGYVYINGKKYSVIGRVCMNNMFVKVDSSVSVGDYVEIFGDRISLSGFAKNNNKSEYESLLSINKML